MREKRERENEPKLTRKMAGDILNGSTHTETPFIENIVVFSEKIPRQTLPEWIAC